MTRRVCGATLERVTLATAGFSPMNTLGYPSFVLPGTALSRQAVLSTGNVAPSGSPVRVRRCFFRQSAAHPPSHSTASQIAVFNY